jgi:hypothetical protein
MLVSSIAPSMAEEYGNFFRTPSPLPGPSSTKPERSSDNSVLWGVGIAATVVIGCAFLGCFDGDDAPTSTNSGNNYRRPDSTSNSGGDYDNSSDTSIGCVWGDRKYGTCH